MTNALRPGERIAGYIIDPNLKTVEEEVFPSLREIQNIIPHMVTNHFCGGNATLCSNTVAAGTNGLFILNTFNFPIRGKAVIVGRDRLSGLALVRPTMDVDEVLSNIHFLDEESVVPVERSVHLKLSAVKMMGPWVSK